MKQVRISATLRLENIVRYPGGGDMAAILRSDGISALLKDQDIENWFICVDSRMRSEVYNNAILRPTAGVSYPVVRRMRQAGM